MRKSNKPNTGAPTTSSMLDDIGEALSLRPTSLRDSLTAIGYGVIGITSDALNLGLRTARRVEESGVPSRFIRKAEEIGGIGALMLASGATGSTLYLRNRLPGGQSSKPAPTTPEGFPTDSQLAEAGINPQIVAARRGAEDRSGILSQFAAGVGISSVARGVGHD